MVVDFQNVDILKDAEVVKNLANILKTNVAACKSIGSPFLSQVSDCIFFLKQVLPNYLRFFSSVASIWTCLTSTR